MSRGAGGRGSGASCGAIPRGRDSLLHTVRGAAHPQVQSWQMQRSPSDGLRNAPAEAGRTLGADDGRWANITTLAGKTVTVDSPRDCVIDGVS